MRVPTYKTSFIGWGGVAGAAGIIYYIAGLRPRPRYVWNENGRRGAHASLQVECYVKLMQTRN